MNENNVEAHCSDILEPGQSDDDVDGAVAASGKSEDADMLQELRKKRIYSLAAVTKKRNQLAELMTSDRNLLQVKQDFDRFLDLFKRYEEAYMLYFLALPKPRADKEAEEFAEKNEVISDFRTSARKWIHIVEQRVQNDRSSASGSCSKSHSSRSSSRRSSTSSSKSARVKEKAKLAELLVEKSMLKEKKALKDQERALKDQERALKDQEQALKDQEEEFLLDVEIAKSKAREEAYASDLGSIISRHRPAPSARSESPVRPDPIDHADHSDSSCHLSIPSLDYNVTDQPLQSRNIPKGSFKSPQRIGPDGNTPRSKKTTLDPNAPVFYTNAQMYQTLHQDISHMQKQQNDQMLVAHQALASAVALPHPEISKFKGDSIQYNTFIRSFDARITSLTSKPEDMMYYLEQHLEGEARELISGCLYMEPSIGYVEARSLLEKEYGDPYKVSMAYINKVLDWPTIKHDDSQGLKRFSIFLMQCQQAMKSISHMQVLDHAPNMQLMVQKLPTYLQNKWRDSVSKLRSQRHTCFITRFEDLVIFVKHAAEAANDPVFGREALQTNHMQSKTSRTSKDDSKDKRSSNKHSVSSFAVKTSTSSSSGTKSFSTSGTYKKTCQFCNGSHDIDECTTFNKKNTDEKRAYLKEKNLCFGCFGYNHTSKGCLRKRTCTKCGKCHPTSLHIDGFVFRKVKMEDATAKEISSEGGGEANPQVSSAACNATTSSTVLHAILPVKIHQKGSDVTVCTYAFYDSGSSGCFLTEELAHDLKATSSDTTLQLRTMHGTDYVKSSSVNNLIVADMSGGNAVQLPKAFTRKDIPVSHQQIPKPEMMKPWPHLESVVQDMPQYLPDIGIGLLIGNNCPYALEPLEVIHSEDGGPFAVKLHHGWTINGPLKIEINKDSVTCNRVIVQEMETTKEVLQPSAILKMFEQDFDERDNGCVPGELGYSKEDIKFLTIAEKCKKDESGHFEMRLPFRKEDVSMPHNRENAVSRAKWQRRKMLQDEKYQSDYCTFMDTIIKKGYAIKAEKHSSSLENGKYWFLPHHGIYHPKKPEKIRVVFDCSARCHGISLNDKLLQGPDLTNSLVGVLTRFREEPVAFMADIEAMFHQVKVPSDQQDFLRFLWWPEGNLEQGLQEYKMTVHLFGAVSSPSVANFALKRCADEAENQYGTMTASTIRRNFYVDDCLKSVLDEMEAQDLVSSVKEACSDGGFKLTKFTSTSVKVMKGLSKDELSKELQARDLDYSSLPIERVLGIQWSVEQDLFKFSVFLPAKPPTRRGILSMVSSVYDPLGFLAPFILSAKRILQDLCQEPGIGWDDEVPSDYKNRWEKWIAELPMLEKIQVNRCLKFSNTDPPTSREIHVFSDASSVGYGCAAYLRLCDQAGNVQTSFLLGKARLAPIKKITIPRMELTAATVAVKIGRMLERELEKKPDRIVYHTDSTTVLHYLHSERKRFPVFVSNRVQLINDYSSPQQWRYVESKENPADVASRGLSDPQLLQDSIWLDGPSFLRTSEEYWPQQPVSFEDESEETSNAVSVHDECDAMDTLISHYSDWYRLRRAAAVFLRFRKFLLNQARMTPTLDCHKGVFSSEELHEAELSIVKWVQRQHFGAEVRYLEQSKSDSPHRGRANIAKGPKNHSLHRLDPFLDTEGLLRVGGRLSKASISMETRHPALLPKKHHIALLIVRAAHTSLGHAGRNHVLASVREKYWIVAGNSLARHVLSKCVSCRRFRKPVSQQKMSDLPADRLDPAPPFTNTGVDLFGPFIVKEGRKEVKRYGVLFTCLVSRAVHIETANSLTTDSFLHALRRFVARRGNVKLMRSDNGTNFVGARKELLKELQEMDHDGIHDQLLKSNIDWKFNPPAASHMGGVWERQIRSVRNVLDRLLDEFASRLDDEALRTLLCEAEAIVNSRPLTAISDDPDDLQPLSPSQLLTMKTDVPLPLPGCFQKEDVYSRKKWRQVQYLANLFWSRWKREYLTQLQSRQKWVNPKRNLEIGDLVLMKEDDLPRNKWNLGRVTKVDKDDHGHVRSVMVHTQNSDYRRPISKLVLLLPVNEQL